MESALELLELYLHQINQKIALHTKNAVKYKRWWMWAQWAILFFGIITPFIVAFRKNPAMPTAFWVWWCMITPPLTAFISWFISYYDIKDNMRTAARRANALQLVFDKGRMRLAGITEHTQYTQLYEQLTEEVSKIETL
jgi:hypothetical protein